MKICDHSCEERAKAIDTRHPQYSTISIRILLHRLAKLSSDIQLDAVLEPGHAHEVYLAIEHIRALYFGDATPWSIDPDVIARLKTSLEFGKQKRYLAVPIDVGDIEAILTALGDTDAR